METKAVAMTDSRAQVSNYFPDSSGFHKSINITRTISRVCGIWPELEEKKSIAARYYFIVPTIVIFFTMTVPQVRRAVLHRKDLSAVLELMTTGIVMELIALLKLLGIRLNESGLRWLLRRMIDDWKTSNSKERNIMQEYSNLTRFIMTLCITLTIGNVVAQTTKQFAIYFMERYQSMANETVIKPTFLKSDFYFNEQPEGIYEAVVAAQILGGFYVAFAFTACDGFFVFSILHVSGQICNLQLQIEGLVQNHEQRRCSFIKVLAPIVVRHRDLRGYAAVIEENFNKIFLVQMIATSIFLCLQGFEFAMVITKSGSEMVPYLMFILCFVASNLVSIFTYCYVAERLREQSENLFRAIFEIRWYDLAPNDSKLLIIIMTQTKTPIEITVGKFVAFSLGYFCSVLKTSAGYLSMLLAVQDRL
ncbi:odorant receptor 27 [Nasonia vitripennis]|uniref:Odorant receptor n=1 Tax=Nasonia vitripennis TaxID=7425 RepID=A0A7M6UDZ2_NASVI|nr:odorant receptor 27 [Nasonia vitripennis]